MSSQNRTVTGKEPWATCSSEISRTIFSHAASRGAVVARMKLARAGSKVFAFSTSSRISRRVSWLPAVWLLSLHWMPCHSEPRCGRP